MVPIWAYHSILPRLGLTLRGAGEMVQPYEIQEGKMHCLAGSSSMEKALGVGGQHETAVNLAAMKAKTFMGCVNRGRDHGK